MKELTSSYDDLEKRMAIYLGLGALLFTSLYLVIKGADIFTFAIRGLAVLAVFTAVGWIYGHWLVRTVKAHSEDDELPTNVERQRRDAVSLDHGTVVSNADLPDMVIPAEAAKATPFAFDDFGAPAEGQAPMQAMAAAPLPDPNVAFAMEDSGDLPPPPVPAGA